MKVHAPVPEVESAGLSSLCPADGSGGLDSLGQAMLLQAVLEVAEGPVLDLGAGDGRIGIALAEQLQCSVALVEIDPCRAARARNRLAASGLSGRVLCADYFGPLNLPREAFRCVISNPPQLPTGGICWSTADCGGPDGLLHLRRIANVASIAAAPGTDFFVHLLGFLPLESSNRGEGIRQILERNGFGDVRVIAERWAPLRRDGATTRELDYVLERYGNSAFRCRHGNRWGRKEVVEGAAQVEIIRRIMAATKAS